MKRINSLSDFFLLGSLLDTVLSEQAGTTLDYGIYTPMQW